MTSVINLRKLDFAQEVDGDDLFRLKGQVDSLITQSFRYWQTDGTLRQNETSSFGVTIKVVRGDNLLELRLDEPATLFDFAHLYGSDRQRYAANALRKVRATARTGTNTLLMRLAGGDDAFVDLILDGDDTPEMLKWGEFQYGGAVMLTNGKSGDDKITVLVGISGFSQEEDDLLAKLIAGFCLVKLAEQDEAKAAPAKDQSPVNAG